MGVAREREDARGWGGGHRPGPGEYLREGRPRRSRARAQERGERAAEAGRRRTGEAPSTGCPRRPSSHRKPDHAPDRPATPVPAALAPARTHPQRRRRRPRPFQLRLPRLLPAAAALVAPESWKVKPPPPRAAASARPSARAPASARARAPARERPREREPHVGRAAPRASRPPLRQLRSAPPPPGARPRGGGGGRAHPRLPGRPGEGAGRRCGKVK